MDTNVPTIALNSLNNGDALISTSRVTGSVDGTGSTIVALSYTIDGGVANPIAFDPATGLYDQTLPVANLGIGPHTIAITTQDTQGMLQR